MIVFAGNEMWIDGNQSFGPYGYLCLGLAYHWNDEQEKLVLKNLILVKVDIRLRECIEISLYSDMFERPVDEVTEKDGIHYFKELPILNYDMLNMPEQLDAVMTERTEKMFFIEKTIKEYTFTDGAKLPVNRNCIPPNAIYDGKYEELYSCVLGYNKRKREGHIVGFDVLGKILQRDFCLKNLTNDDEIRMELMKDISCSWCKSRPEYEAKQKKCGFLNFNYRINKDGKLTCSYKSVWESK